MSSFNRLVISVGVLGCVATSAFAQAESAMFFTCKQYRPAGGGAGFLPANTNPVPPASPILPYAASDSILGRNAVLYLEPPGPTLTPAPAVTSGSFQLWLSVATKYTGASSEQLISSVGFNLTTPVSANPPTPPANRRGLLVNPVLTMHTTQAATNSAGAQLWDGVNIVTAPLTDARGVTVPDSVGDFGVGATPTTTAGNAGIAGATSYRVATLTFGAAGPTGGNTCRLMRPTRYDIFAAVGNVLTTRAVNPAFGGALSPEAVAFGYVGTGAVAELTASNGSTLGATTVTPDAAVEICVKGDMDGNGFINAADALALNSVVGAAGAAIPRDRFRGDLDNNGFVNAADNLAFPGRSTTYGALAACP